MLTHFKSAVQIVWPSMYLSKFLDREAEIN